MPTVEIAYLDWAYPDKNSIVDKFKPVSLDAQLNEFEFRRLMIFSKTIQDIVIGSDLVYSPETFLPLLDILEIRLVISMREYKQ